MVPAHASAMGPGQGILRDPCTISKDDNSFFSYILNPFRFATLTPELVLEGEAASNISNQNAKPKWRTSLDAATLNLPRTRDCFNQIELDDRLHYDLPSRPNITAGLILKHAYSAVDRLIAKYQPCIFKVGYTHCAYYRFYNDLYGYIRETDRWEKMVVIYAASETTSPAFVEGALIQRHKGALFVDRHALYIGSHFPI